MPVFPAVIYCPGNTMFLQNDLFATKFQPDIIWNALRTFREEISIYIQYQSHAYEENHLRYRVFPSLRQHAVQLNNGLVTYKRLQEKIHFGSSCLLPVMFLVTKIFLTGSSTGNFQTLSLILSFGSCLVSIQLAGRNILITSSWQPLLLVSINS